MRHFGTVCLTRGIGRAAIYRVLGPGAQVADGHRGAAQLVKAIDPEWFWVTHVCTNILNDSWGSDPAGITPCGTLRGAISGRDIA